MSHAEALAHLRGGRPGVAAAMLEAQLHREPRDAESWFLLGACRHTLNDLRAAALAFTRSLQIDPVRRQAHLALVTVLRAAGELGAALAAAESYLVRSPNDEQAPYAVALCYEDLGDLDAALAHYDRALVLAADFEDALHNRGILLARLGRFDEAEAHQRRDVAVHPGSARACSALVDVLLASGKFEQALQAIERMPPGDLTALIRRGVALASLKRYAEAHAAFSQARSRDAEGLARYLQRISPGSDPQLMLSPENLFFWQANLAQRRCDWSAWDAFLAEMRRLAATSQGAVEGAVAFMAFHLPLSGKERHAIARHVAIGFEAAAPAMPPPAPPCGGKIRIGLLSPDLREHLNAYLLLPLFELLDRRRFELHAYSLSPDDGSDIRGRLRAAASRFQELTSLTDQEAAARIREDGIDILLDAAGHTTGGRFGIVARRPALLQVLYLGFAGSLGSQRVDYAIVDRVVAADPFEWSEHLVNLPSTYYLYDFRERSAAPVKREEYGLPSSVFVYCAFHKAEKITPDAFELWLEILRRTPHAVLWLLDLPSAAKMNLRRRAQARGVQPERLIFAPFDPRERYLARQRLGDLLLDSLHHSAMTTACDALAAGLPLLTIAGSTVSSRAADSLLRAARMPELVVRDPAEFVRTAVELAKPGAIAAVKEKLSANRGSAPLFDTGARIKELQRAFEGMMERARRGAPPRSFEV